jgi:hypothetical protein
MSLDEFTCKTDMKHSVLEPWNQTTLGDLLDLGSIHRKRKYPTQDSAPSFQGDFETGRVPIFDDDGINGQGAGKTNECITVHGTVNNPRKSDNLDNFQPHSGAYIEKNDLLVGFRDTRFYNPTSGPMEKTVQRYSVGYLNFLLRQFFEEDDVQKNIQSTPSYALDVMKKIKNALYVAGVVITSNNDNDVVSSGASERCYTLSGFDHAVHGTTHVNNMWGFSCERLPGNAEDEFSNYNDPVGSGTRLYLGLKWVSLDNTERDQWPTETWAMGADVKTVYSDYVIQLVPICSNESTPPVHKCFSRVGDGRLFYVGHVMNIGKSSDRCSSNQGLYRTHDSLSYGTTDETKSGITKSVSPLSVEEEYTLRRQSGLLHVSLGTGCHVKLVTCGVL